MRFPEASTCEACGPCVGAYTHACMKVYAPTHGTHVPLAHVFAEGRDIDGYEVSGDCREAHGEHEQEYCT